MRVNFRDGFYAGLLVALIVGVYLARLWQPERQIELHNAHLLSQIEKKNWATVAEFVADDYQDRWGNDRALLLEGLREVFRALPNVRIEPADPVMRTENSSGYWTAKITIRATGEFAAMIEARVNSLPAPFELEWPHRSAKPWDWKLVCVRNPELEISGL
ncbi:MAG: hypothetical protein DLM73_04205 [Chthoniobacterales bacterium]|nr:MAG: hypothetical protein DLM73_04205 [Chthoniobacterales bacterium]